MAILLGVATAAFLLIGIAMNVTFVLMGVVNPSAFYTPMQATLLMGDAGSVFGFGQARASERVRTLRRWRVRSRRSGRTSGRSMYSPPPCGLGTATGGTRRHWISTVRAHRRTAHHPKDKEGS